MEITREEDPQSSEIPLDDKDQLLENAVPVHQNVDFKEVETKFNMSDEEIKEIMEPIAATGKFWHEWDELKSILSFRLKQVLAEYPESQVDNDVGSQDESLTGETYSELVRRLDEALLSFIEGPPFTLQRLCEILLAPRSLYPKLSKLALALDKNLLVTSTLTRSTGPPAMPEPEVEPEAEPGIANGPPEEESDPAPGGELPATSNEDREMVEAEADEDVAAKDEEIQEEMAGKQEDGSGSGQNHG